MNMFLWDLRKIFPPCVLLCLPVAQHASAVCTASAATTPALINFGSHPSQSVPAGGLSSNGSGVSATFEVSCSVLLTLQLLSTTSWLRLPMNCSTAVLWR